MIAKMRRKTSLTRKNITISLSLNSVSRKTSVNFSRKFQNLRIAALSIEVVYAGKTHRWKYRQSTKLSVSSKASEEWMMPRKHGKKIRQN